MVEVKIVNDIDDLAADEWDRLIACAPFSSHRWLRFASSVGADFRPSFILLYRDSKLVGGACITFTHRPDTSVKSAWGGRTILTLLRRYPLLSVKIPLASLSGLILPDDDRLGAFQTIHQTIRAIAAERKALFVLLDWLAAEDGETIRESGDYIHMQMGPGTMLPITWASFEEYRQSLSKNMREKLRHDMSYARRFQIRVERTREASRYAGACHDLIENVYRKYHSIGTNYYDESFFKTAEQQLTESVMLLGWRGDDLAGCMHLICDQGVMLLGMIGLDYRYDHVYFHLFYESIRYAIENNIRLIRGGGGSYEFKHRLGFQDEPSHLTYYSHRALFQQVGRFLSRLVS